MNIFSCDNNSRSDDISVFACLVQYIYMHVYQPLTVELDVGLCT